MGLTNMMVTAIALTILSLFSVVSCSGGNMPAKWWMNTHAKAIHSITELKDLVQGEARSKHIFVDFYMQQCKWCYLLQEDFNRISDDMIAWFGPN